MATIEGLDHLLKNLDNLPRVVARKLVARSLRKGAKPLEDEMGARAPVDSGALAGSVVTVVGEQTATGATARIGPAKWGFYGLFQELGTAHHPRQEFMQPAFEAKRDEIVSIIAKDLGDGIEREAKG